MFAKLDVGLIHQRLGDLAIAASHVAGEEEANGRGAIAVDQFEGIDDIAGGLGHLVSAGAEPVGMDRDAPWQGLSQRHQNARPVNGVGLDDVLADQMLGLRPPRLVSGFGPVQVGQVVDQGVEPDIGDVVVIKWQWHAQGDTRPRSRDAEIVERLAQKRADGVGVDLRLDPGRARVEVFEEARSIRFDG